MVRKTKRLTNFKHYTDFAVFSDRILVISLVAEGFSATFSIVFVKDAFAFANVENRYIILLTSIYPNLILVRS